MKYTSIRNNLNIIKKLVFILILFVFGFMFNTKVFAYTVTYPDGITDTVEEGEKYILSMKDHKEPETISTVTFKSHQDGVDDYVSHVKKKYFLEKWIIDGVEYEPGSPIEVNSDITVTGSYHEYIEPVTIPSAPLVYERTFIGWYDQEEGGTRYKTYSGTQDLTLHAQYIVENKAPFNVEFTSSKWTKFKSTATAFRKATVEEYNAKQAELTSSDNYGNDYHPIYIWLEGTELVYYTESSSITITSPNKMFNNWSKIEYIDLSGWYIRYLYSANSEIKATDISNMFYNCSSLTYLDISDFDTSKVTNMNYMFSGTKLASLDLSHFNTSKVTEMAGMFSNMGSLEYLNISSFDTSKVTSMQYMFSNSNINYLDLSNFNTSNVTGMASMFNNSKNTNYLNISSFDTSKVTYMTSMFAGSSFKHLDLSNLDVSQANSFEGMFYNAQSLEYVDLSNWDTRRSKSFSRMFKNCYNLKYLDLSSFKIYKATNLSQMFQGCRNLEELDLSSFDLNNVEYISYMFAEMSKIKTIDISNFSTPNLKNMQCLFCDDTSLETIYANELFNTDQCPTGVMSDGTMVYVFVRNDNLVGQAGTRFSEAQWTGKEYAVIDDPDNGKPGYFTYKAYNPKIYYPDMSYEEVEPYYVLTLPESYSKADDNLATVTLKYEDGKTEDKEVYIKKNYTFNNWLVYDEVAEPGDTFVITFDTYLEADYVETTVGADLSPAYRENYKFTGWYTDPENGDLVESYTAEEDITLYAHWSEAITVPVTTPDGIVYVPYGEEYNLGVNDLYDFYGEAEYVYLDYNLGDDSDPPMTVMAEFLKGNGWLIDGVHYDDNSVITVTEPITIERDNVIDKPPYVLPHPTNGNKYFAGWYAWGNFDSEPYEVYYGGGDITLVARWIDDPVNLTIDGKTKVVERGYVYTVPNATPDPYAPVNNKIHIHLYYMDEEDTQKDVVIYEGYSIGYQIINNDIYYPGDTYVVNDETEVVSIYDWNGQYAMDPYIKEPTRDGYIFMGWQLYNWEYYDVSDINVDIYNIEPYYTWFDGASFYAEWQEEPDPDEYVVVRYKDFMKKKDYKKIYPKGYVYTFENLREVNPFDIEIRNNVNDDTATVTSTTYITSDSYAVKIVGSDDESWRNSNNWYHPGDTYEINEDIEIEVISSAHTSNSYYDDGCSGDTYLCELAYDTADNSRYNNYIFRGVYTEENGQGAKLNPNAVTNNNTYYGSHNGFNPLWVYLEEVDENSVIVTVDGEVFIMPKGEGTIPSPSITSETVNYIITYKFNNGDPDVLGIDTVRYYIGSLYYNGDEYQLGDTFDFEEDTTFWSNWEFEPIGDGLLEVNDEHFLGWYDINDNQVTSLDDIDDNITLYAHWDYPDVNVTLEGETDTVPYGFTFDLAGFKNFQSTVDAGTITFHDESGNYEGEVWTTSAQQTPSKAYINGVEYELDGEYTFIEDTVIEFEYEFEFTDEILPLDKYMSRYHYTFGGWYDNPDGMNNIDVYAKWIGEEVIVILNEDEDNPLIYHYGDTYTFGDLPESFVWDMGNEIFDFNDGVTPNSTQHLIMTIYMDIKVKITIYFLIS